MTSHNAIAGCLLGGAVGDAFGAPIEFLELDAIRARFGADGLRELAPAYGGVGKFTDDTQMTLFTAEGFLRADVRSSDRGICHAPSVVHHAYAAWREIGLGPLVITPGDNHALDVLCATQLARTSSTARFSIDRDGPRAEFAAPQVMVRPPEETAKDARVRDVPPGRVATKTQRRVLVAMGTTSWSSTETRTEGSGSKTRRTAPALNSSVKLRRARLVGTLRRRELLDHVLIFGEERVR